jgi:chromate transport protein ChrA
MFGAGGSQPAGKRKIEGHVLMTDAQAATEKNAKHLRLLGWLLSATLIFNFLWRVFTTANEYPPRATQVMEMTLDVLMFIGLFAVRTKIPMPVFVIALIAGIGLFGIRLHSDASWWTGHWNYSIR